MGKVTNKATIGYTSIHFLKVIQKYFYDFNYD